MNFIASAKLILSLLPVLVEAIKAAEGFFEGSGKGAAKLELIRVALESAYGLTKDARGTFAEIWPALEGFISNAVAVFNRVGTFKK